MKKILSFVMPILIACTFSCNKREGKPRVLVFTKNTYYYHESIPAGVAAIRKLGQENGFDVDTTSNAEIFNEDSLEKYSAVIFLIMRTTRMICSTIPGSGFSAIHTSGRRLCWHTCGHQMQNINGVGM